MAVTPLSSPPIPVNSNLERAVFMWVTSVGGSQDPISSTNVQTTINNLGTLKCNTVYLDIWAYLGGANYTTAHQTTVQTFVDACHKSGVRVYALAGNTDWAINQAWVMKNVVLNIARYQAAATLPTHKFDGVILDVEYWTDGGQTAAVSCPGLCDLIRAIRARLDLLPVGCFAAFYLKDSTGTRPTLTYQGKTAQDGDFLMDNSDFVVVGAYRNHAADNGTDGPGQVTLFTPWNGYASAVGENLGLLCGSETTNVSPSYITYFGMTKAAMETEHTTISSTFQVPANASFIGQSIDSYDGWKAMS